MAKKLTNQELQTRLAFDFKVAMAMQCEVMTVSAYRNIDDLLGGKRKITAESEGHLAKYYLAEYNIKTLIGKGKYTTGPTRVQIDLLINGNYPFAEPRCDVVNSDLPWSPHFKQGYPIWGVFKNCVMRGKFLFAI